MSQDWAKAFYASSNWKKCRETFMESKFWLCERCLIEEKVTPSLICHHREYLTPQNINNPDITLNWDNLESLCLECHNKEHGIAVGLDDEEDEYYFDPVTGDIKPKIKNE